MKNYKQKWFELKEWIENDIKYWEKESKKISTQIERVEYYTRISHNNYIIEQMNRIYKEKLPWEE